MDDADTKPKASKQNRKKAASSKHSSKPATPKTVPKQQPGPPPSTTSVNAGKMETAEDGSAVSPLSVRGTKTDDAAAEGSEVRELESISLATNVETDSSNLTDTKDINTQQS